MGDQQLMHEGLSLMVFGMGFVFVFLTLLVIATTLMSRAVTRWAPAPVVDETPSRRPPAAADDSELMAVIAAAVHRYRRRHRR